MPENEDHYTHRRLREYWNSLKGNRPFPEEKEIDSNAIADIWPSCFLINIDDVTRRLGYRYSYLGADLMEAFSDDSGQPDVARLLSTADMSMIKIFDKVCKNKKPAVDAAEFVNLKKLRIKYRISLFPLGDSNGEISYILGCMRWKVC